MSAITLTPPANFAPYKTSSLASGAIARPNFEKDGQVTVDSESDAAALEREGWTRLSSPVAKRAAPEPDREELRKRSPATARLFDVIDEINRKCARIQAFDKAAKTAPRYDASLPN